jgi:hypothetical protein
MAVAMAVVVATFAWVASSEAIAVVCPLTDGASCTGTLTYTYPGGSPVNATHATLELHLLNTGVGSWTALGVELPDTPDQDVKAVGLLAGSDDWIIKAAGSGLPGFDVVSQEGTKIAPGDTLDLLINLSGSAANLSAFSDAIIASLTNATANCPNQAGDQINAWGCIHVQALPDGSSTKLPLRGPQEVPEPGLLVILGGGLMGLAGLGAWRAKRA